MTTELAAMNRRRSSSGTRLGLGIGVAVLGSLPGENANNLHSSLSLPHQSLNYCAEVE